MELIVYLSEIDHAMFVLNVDLWNAEGTREVNLVRSSAASSSASSSSTNAPGFGSRNVTEATPGMNSLPPGREAPYSQQCPPPNPPEYASHASYPNGKLPPRRFEPPHIANFLIREQHISWGWQLCAPIAALPAASRLWNRSADAASK